MLAATVISQKNFTGHGHDRPHLFTSILETAEDEDVPSSKKEGMYKNLCI